MFDAINLALDDCASQNGWSAIVVLTDGEDVGSRIDRYDMLRAVEGAGVSVYAIGIKSDNLDIGVLSEIAVLSRGEFAEVDGTSNLTMVYDDVRRNMVGMYRLVFTDPDYTLDVDTLELKVGDSEEMKLAYGRDGIRELQ